MKFEVEHTGLFFLFTCQPTNGCNCSSSVVNVRAHLLRNNLSAGSDKIHAKSNFLSTWWSTDLSKYYTVGRLMDLLFSPNLFFSEIICIT